MRSKEESLDHEVRAFNIRVSLIEPAYTRSAFDQNALEPDAKLKNYDQARAGTHALLQDVMPKADPPELVADVVLRAATDRRPQRRYTAGKIARQISLLRRFRARPDVRQESAQTTASARLKNVAVQQAAWQLLALSGTLVPT